MESQFKTVLGNLVLQGKITTLEELFSTKLPILQPEIIRKLTSLKQLPVHVRRVNKTRKSGKQSRYSVLAAVGNGTNLFGIGTAKNKQKNNARIKAVNIAIKNSIFIDTTTDKEESVNRVGSSIISITPLPKGTGIKSGPKLKELALLAGINDCRISISGSNNPLNYMKAFYNCLKQYEAK